MNALAPTITIQKARPKSASERRHILQKRRSFQERQRQEEAYFQLKATFAQLKAEEQIEVFDGRPTALLDFCLKPHTIEKLGSAGLVQWASDGARLRLTPQVNPRNGMLQVRVSDARTNKWLCVWDYAAFWSLDRWLKAGGR